MLLVVLPSNCLLQESACFALQSPSFTANLIMHDAMRGLNFQPVVGEIDTDYAQEKVTDPGLPSWFLCLRKIF